MPERRGYGFGLVYAAAAHRADVHLDQSDYIRVFLLQEADDVLKIARVAKQVAGARDGNMGRSTSPYRVADVIYEETHVLDSVIRCQPSL